MILAALDAEEAGDTRAARLVAVYLERYTVETCPCPANHVARSVALEDLADLGDYGAMILEHRCLLYCPPDGHEVQFAGPALRALGSRRESSRDRLIADVEREARRIFGWPP
jgi:hypothetical protein